jgi:hypothetical protein
MYIWQQAGETFATPGCGKACRHTNKEQLTLPCVTQGGIDMKSKEIQQCLQSARLLAASHKNRASVVLTPHLTTTPPPTHTHTQCAQKFLPYIKKTEYRKLGYAIKSSSLN